MASNDQRKPEHRPEIDPQQIDEAVEQLDAEIKLLREWLGGAANSENGSVERRDARLAYRDKLRSRTEMREALLNQRKALTSKKSDKNP